jgi:hypothetical protein
MKQAADTKDLRKMDFDMVEENFSIRMEAIMMVNGKRIKCMDGENYFIKEVSLLTKEIGHTISFMDTVKFITIIHKN